MTTEPPPPDADSHDPGDRFAPPNATPDGEPVPPRQSRGLLIAAWGLGVAVIIAATVLVTTLILSADDEAAIETTDPLDSATTTTTTKPDPDPDPEPEPEPTTPDTQPDTPAVLDEPAGLFCRDLNAKGYNYNEAVDYWEHHGRPVNMDAAGNGIPCQTVYPTSQVEAQWGPLPGGSINTGSPLLAGFGDAVRYADSVGLPNLQSDLATLNSRTNSTWTRDMLLALGSSYCNDWPSESGGEDFTVVSAAGKDQWARAVAPVLGIGVDDARSAIETNIWSSYQFVCE